MAAIEELLDTAKRTCSLPSDMTLAARLGVSRALLSGWRKGLNRMQDDDIAQAAKLAKMDAGVWLVKVHAEQARGEAARSWQAIAKKLANIAAVIVIAVLLVPEAHAGTHEAAALGSGLLLWILRIMCTTCETEQTATPQGSAHAHRQTALLA